MAASPFIRNEIRAEKALLLAPPEGMPVPYYRVELRSADDPNHMRGTNVGWVWIDESRDISKDAYTILMGNLIDTRGKMIMTTTPMGKKHWLFSEFMSKVGVDPQYAALTGVTTYDNNNLSPEEVKAFEESVGPELARQEVYGEFIDLGDLVLPMFDRGMHTVKWDGSLAGGKLFCGIDFGYSHDFVCVWILEKEDYYHVIAEYVAKYKTADIHAMRLKSHPLSPYVTAYYCDPNMLQPRMELQREGVPLVPAPMSYSNKGEELMSGVRLISRLLSETGRDGRFKLRIDPCCEVLIRSMGGWRNKTSKDEPSDKGRDACDALRYALRANSPERLMTGVTGVDNRYNVSESPEWEQFWV
jgi:PBSX family phage terminase large subunit